MHSIHFRKESAFITALMHFMETIHGTHIWTKSQLLFSVLPWYVGLSCQLRFVDWIHISFCELMYLTHEHLRGTRYVCNNSSFKKPRTRATCPSPIAVSTMNRIEISKLYKNQQELCRYPLCRSTCTCSWCMIHTVRVP